MQGLQLIAPLSAPRPHLRPILLPPPRHLVQRPPPWAPAAVRLRENTLWKVYEHEKRAKTTGSFACRPDRSPSASQGRGGTTATKSPEPADGGDRV